MKIVFLCGSLEPGRDGVGDYTRRLAGELIKQNVEVAAIALNDTYLTHELMGIQHSDGIDLQVLRIPSSWNQKDRFKRAHEWIELLNPEWLSLQFVLFSFHAKGLPFTLNNWLKRLGKGRRWHIMFHELWVGMDIHSSRKLIWWGRLQQYLISNLIPKLKPEVIHTQTRLYQALLTQLDFATEYLPLFGNIPVINTIDNSVDKITAPSNTKETIRLVYFGGIHPGAPVEAFANEVAAYSHQFAIPVSLTILGRSGVEQLRWAAAWKSAGLAVEVLGEQPAEYISKIMSTASLGISTTPIPLVEKSGAIAAMREHGLSVLCITLPWQARHGITYDPPPGIFEYRNGIVEELLTTKKRFSYSSQIVQIALQFLKSLPIIPTRKK